MNLNDTKTDALINDLFCMTKQGDKKSASRLMRMIEDGDLHTATAVAGHFDMTSKVHRIGITGWPGVGKSTLINALAKTFLDSGRRIGIVAVDPTSPFSGGSLLGDRQRFRDVDGHPDVFIRSMASRGQGGGISRAARGVIKVLEAMGKDVILFETVGVGQDQVAVSSIVDTTVMVTAPGLGDFLQALKAGVLEAAEIFVVNKADHPMAEQAAADLKALIEMTSPLEGWVPRLVSTVAVQGKGIVDLLKSIEAHRRFGRLKSEKDSRRNLAIRREILEIVSERCLEALARRTDLYRRLPELVDRVLKRRQDPLSIADALIRECKLTDAPSIEDSSGGKYE